jgi:hypothetical protein
MLQELTQEIENTAKAVVNEIHTALPGEIVSYDAGAGTAAVQPVGKFVTSDGTELAYPTITEAPVCFPFCQNAGVGIAFPVKKGDSCIIIISEVELDAWRSGAESEGSLRFDLTSAMIIPGLLEGGCVASQKASSENAVVVTAGDVTVTVSGGGCMIDTGSTVMNVTDSGVSIKGNLNVTGNIKAGSISQ